jgi:hypothetical protein
VLAALAVIGVLAVSGVSGVAAHEAHEREQRRFLLLLDEKILALWGPRRAENEDKDTKGLLAALGRWAKNELGMRSGRSREGGY